MIRVWTTGLSCFRLGALLVFGVTAGQGVMAEEKLLDFGAAEWRYADAGNDTAAAWAAQEFDDSGWKMGQAPLGYGDDDIKTQIPYGDNAQEKTVCVLFRHVIEVKPDASAKRYLVSFTCDDAAAIYVNGEEVHRYNLPQGELKATTQAELPAAGDMERFRMLFLVDASKLKPGKNVIAARVHQVLPSSSDLEFDLALTALTSDEEVAETAKKVEQSSNDLEKLTEEIQQALRARSQN